MGLEEELVDLLEFHHSFAAGGCHRAFERYWPSVVG